MNNYIKNKQQSTLLLVTLVCAIFAAVALFNLGGYSYSRYFAILIVILSALLNIDNTYYLIVFCFPFASILKLSTTSISILPVLYMIVLFKLVLLKKVRVNTNALVAIAVIVAFQFIYILSYNSSIVSIISIVLNILFVMFSASYLQTRDDNKNFLISTAVVFLIISVALNILLSDIFTNVPYIIDSEKQLALDVDKRFGALLVEPNELAQIILIAIGLFMAIFTSIESKIWRVVLTIVVAYIGINGLRTNSRSYVLVALAMFVITLILYLNNVAKQKGASAVLLRIIPICIVLVFVSTYFFNNIIMPLFEERAATGSDFLSNRGEVWNNYLTMLMRRPDVLFGGYGIGNVAKSLTLIDIDSFVVPHNLYIEFIIQFGIVGLCLWFVAWGGVWKSTLQKAKTFFMLPLLAFAITSLAISANSNDCFYILMLILCMPFIGETSEKNNSQEDELEC